MHPSLKHFFWQPAFTLWSGNPPFSFTGYKIWPQAHLPAPCSGWEVPEELLCCPRAWSRTWTPGWGSPSPPPCSTPLRLAGLSGSLWRKVDDLRGWSSRPPSSLVGCPLLLGGRGGPMGRRTGDGEAGGRETNQCKGRKKELAGRGGTLLPLFHSIDTLTTSTWAVASLPLHPGLLATIIIMRNCVKKNKKDFENLQRGPTAGL